MASKTSGGLAAWTIVFLEALPSRSSPDHREEFRSMIRRCQEFEDFERGEERRPPDHAANLRIAEALLDEARQLGILPLANPLEGIEIDIEYARIIRVRPTA